MAWQQHLHLLAILKLFVLTRCEFQTQKLIIVSNLGANTGKDSPFKAAAVSSSTCKECLMGNGLRQFALLGRQFKQDYTSFFEKIDTSKTIFLAAGIPAANQAATAFGQGLWQYKTGAKFPKGASQAFSRPPIPDPDVAFESDFALPEGVIFPSTSQIPPQLDNIFFTDFQSVCPNAYQVVSKTISDDLKPIEGLIKSLSSRMQKAGLSSKTMFHQAEFSAETISTIGRSLTACNQYDGSNCQLSVQLEASLVDDIRRFAAFYDYAIINVQDKVMRLMTHQLGQTLSRLLEDQQIPFAFLSGTRQTLTAILSSLGVLTKSCLQNWVSGKDLPHPECSVGVPSTGSILVLEVLEDLETQERHLRLSFDNKPLRVCGEKTLCSEQEFSRLLEERLSFVGDYTRFCGNPYLGELRQDGAVVQSGKFWLLTAAFALGGFGLLLGWLYKRCSPRSRALSPY